jgi:hypothetical protein
VLRAWRQLQRIRRENAALQELPQAQHMALLANINRDPKKSKAFSATDFAMFQPKERDEAKVAPEVATVALALRHEGKAPPILLAAWPQILASATEAGAPPDIRAFHSDDNEIWILAPTWEGPNIRGGLVAVGRYLDAPVRVRDLDRPLMTYTLRFPQRQLAGYLEAGLLLVLEN